MEVGQPEQGGAAREAPEPVDDVKLSVWHMDKLPGEAHAGFTSGIGFAAGCLNEGSLESRRNQKIVHCLMAEIK